MHAVYGNAEGMRWVGTGQPLSFTQCELWIDVTLQNYVSRGYGLFAMVERTSGTVVGFCGLVHPGSQAEAEIKYALRQEFWGHGFATEAAAALLAFGRSMHGLSQVIATASPEHSVSHRVLLKAGMSLGELRRNEDGSFTQLFSWRAGSGENAL
jgi:RimJ/RimL family protein N-acetyltransferase